MPLIVTAEEFLKALAEISVTEAGM